MIHPKVIGSVTGSALGGAVGVILVWMIRLHGIEVPHEVAGAITTVAGALVSAVGGYFTPDKGT